MCYHEVLGRTVLFGGIDPQIGGTDTTWLYDGTNWVRGRGLRSEAGRAHGRQDGLRRRARRVRAERRMNPNTGTPIVDTWEFNARGWKQVQSVNERSGATACWPTFRPASASCEFGGIAGFTYLADTWEIREAARDRSRLRSVRTACPRSMPIAAPRLGQNYVQDLSNLHPAINVGILVLSLTEIPGDPLDSIGMPGCYAYVSPDVLVTLNGVGGTASHSLAIPSTPNLVGTHAGVPGHLGRSGQPAWLVSSNALGGMIGQ
jgi:hypothetical protein